MNWVLVTFVAGGVFSASTLLLIPLYINEVSPLIAAGMVFMTMASVVICSLGVVFSAPLDKVKRG